MFKSFVKIRCSAEFTVMNEAGQEVSLFGEDFIGEMTSDSDPIIGQNVGVFVSHEGLKGRMRCEFGAIMTGEVIDVLFSGIKTSVGTSHKN